MAADNHTTIVGNLVEDPELRFTNTGTTVTNLRVAVTQRVQQDGEWRGGETSFFKVNVWRGQAEHLADSLSKGPGHGHRAGCASGPGRPLRGRSGRWPRSRPMRSGPASVRHRQGRTHHRTRQQRPQPRPGPAGRTRRRLQRVAALLKN
ncbi:MAG TPA: single-stranded DNA-binding protein [Actinomycetota bacterium]|nr:single-stranded DNA-binding protein [Actinomycetota bacterium]